MKRIKKPVETKLSEKFINHREVIFREEFIMAEKRKTKAAPSKKAKETKGKAKGFLSRMADKMKNNKSKPKASKNLKASRAPMKTAPEKPAPKTRKIEKTETRIQPSNVVKVSKNPTSRELDEVLRRLGVPKRRK